MGMVAPEQRIASAFFVIYGKYGDVTRYSQERGVCRQWIYREAAGLRKLLATARQENEGLPRTTARSRRTAGRVGRQSVNFRIPAWASTNAEESQIAIVGCGNW